MIILDLIYNLSLLVALSVLSGFIDSRFERNSRTGSTMQGVLFGLIAVVGMSYSFVLTEGIIFDGRSIVLSLCALFFGPLAGLISAVIAAVYRLYLGGGGAVTGVLVIVSSFLAGCWFHRWRTRRPSEGLNMRTLYILGVVVHVAMLMLLFTLPTPWAGEAVHTILVTLLGIYPLITVLIGKIFLDHESNRVFVERLRHREGQLRLIVESTNDVIFTLDTEQRYTAIYGTWMREFGLSPHLFLGKRHREVGVDENATLHEAMSTQALLGENVTYEWSVQAPGEHIHFQTKLAPIYEGGNAVGAVGVSRNITELKRAQVILLDQLEKLSQITWIQSHQVRAPLARIMSLAELLQDPQTSEAEMHQLAGLLMESASELDAMVRDIVETAGKSH